MVDDSYVTTLPHAEDSFRASSVVLRNDVRIKFTIHVGTDVFVLSGRLHISEDMSSYSPQFVLRNGRKFTSLVSLITELLS